MIHSYITHNSKSYIHCLTYIIFYFKIVAGPAGRVKSAVSPFGNISVDNLHKQLFERNLLSQINGMSLS